MKLCICDVDGCIIDFSGKLIEMNKEDGKIDPNASAGDSKSWNIHDWIPGLDYSYMNSEEFWADMPVFNNAQEQLERLRENDIFILFLSDCRYYQARYDCLERNNLLYPDQDYLLQARAADKARICKTFGADFAIDDRDTTVKALSKVVDFVGCVSQPWNYYNYGENVYRPATDNLGFPDSGIKSLELIVDNIILKNNFLTSMG